MLPTTITAEWLELKYACERQRDAFLLEWPNGMVVNISNLNRSLEIGLDLVWFMAVILPCPLYEKYESKAREVTAMYSLKRDPLLGEYKARLAPLKAEYKVKLDPINARYVQQFEPFDRKYLAEIALFKAEYEAGVAPLDAEYNVRIKPFRDDYYSERNMLIISTISDYYESEGHRV